jgi:hypothetical protein
MLKKLWGFDKWEGDAQAKRDTPYIYINVSGKDLGPFHANGIPL